MGIKAWLFGKDRKSEDKEAEAIAKLKKRLNELDIEGKNYLRKSEEEKNVAKKMLKSGNKIGAKQALTRANLFLQKYNQVQNMSLNLSTQIDTISTAKSTTETVKALKVGSTVVDETLKTVSPEDVERTMVEMEEQRDRISMMTEALADTTALELDLEGEFADSIDDQLAAMEMELQEEASGSLPEPSLKELKTTDKEKTKDDASDIEDELKALKKELEK